MPPSAARSLVYQWLEAEQRSRLLPEMQRDEGTMTFHSPEMDKAPTLQDVEQMLLAMGYAPGYLRRIIAELRESRPGS